MQPWLSKEAAETELGRYGWVTSQGRRALAESATLILALFTSSVGDDAIAIVGLAESLWLLLAFCIGSLRANGNRSRAALASVTCSLA